MLLLLALNFATGLQAPQDQTAAKITFSEPAAPLSRLMPRLAEVTKMNLKVAPVMATEVLCISVHDVARDDLLRRIADATGAKWTEGDGGYYLTPSPQARAALKQKAFEARAAKLTTDLKKLIPTPPGKGGDNKNEAMVPETMFGAHGGDPIFYQLLSTIGPQQLASMLPGDRAVLSSRPTARQYSLPSSDQAVSEFVARHNAEVDKMAADAKKAGADGEVADAAPEMGMFRDRNGNQRIASPPSKVNLILSRAQGFGALIGGGELNAELVLYDAAGKELTSDRAGLGGLFDMEDMQAMQDEATGKATKPSGAPIELSKETQDFVKYLRSMQMGMGGAPKMDSALRDKVRAKALRPDLYDPMAYPADLLQGFAKQKNLQLVASLPDTFASWLLNLMMSTTTAESLDRRMKKDTSLVVTNADGWLVIAPGDFQSEPIDRANLTKIVNTLANDKTPSIDTFAGVALAGMGEPAHGMLPELCVMIVSPSLSMLFMQDWDMLRFFGSLSPDQRTSLGNSNRLSIAALTEPQKSFLDRMVYGAGQPTEMFGSDGPLRVEVKKPAGSVLGAADEMFNQALAEYGMEGEDPHDYRSEPTEVAPNGLTSAAAVTLKLTTSQVFMPILKTKEPQVPTMFDNAMPIEQLASMVAMRDSPNFAQMSAMMPTFDQVKVGTQRKLHFRIYVSGEAFRSTTLTDSSFPSDAHYALNALPGDLQKKYDTALKQMRDAYKDAGTAGGDGGAAPPM